MFISNCGRNRLRAEHLMRALLLIFFLSAENERERVLKTDTLFRTNIDIFECFFLQYTTEFIRFSSPLNQKKKNSFVVLFSRSNKRAIADQIFSGLEKILSILLGFRKHVRYVACMRARKLSLDNEKLFEKKKRKYVLIFVFWKTSKQKWLTLCQICLFYSLFTHCGGRML